MNSRLYANQVALGPGAKLGIDVSAAIAEALKLARQTAPASTPRVKFPACLDIGVPPIFLAKFLGA
jgi:hypothetical protein